jgi:hypothetical protein
VILPASSSAAEGDRLALRLPRERLHFFDVDTGQRLG